MNRPNAPPAQIAKKKAKKSFEAPAARAGSALAVPSLETLKAVAARSR